MRSFFVLLTLLVACGSINRTDDIESSSNEFNSNPPPPVVCESPKYNCAGVCVDISRDMKNCGDCGEECRIEDGEFCLAYGCRNVRDYGFTFEPNGPREYDIRRDLPRPAPINGDELR